MFTHIYTHIYIHLLFSLSLYIYIYIYIYTRYMCIYIYIYIAVRHAVHSMPCSASLLPFAKRVSAVSDLAQLLRSDPTIPHGCSGEQGTGARWPQKHCAIIGCHASGSTRAVSWRVRCCCCCRALPAWHARGFSTPSSPRGTKSWLCCGTTASPQWRA